MSTEEIKLPVPISNRVLVKRIGEVEKETRGGILIPENQREYGREAEVLAVGRGKTKKGRLVPVSVKVGDKVLISYYAGTDIRLKGEHYVILREDDIDVILREDDIVAHVD